MKNEKMYICIYIFTTFFWFLFFFLEKEVTFLTLLFVFAFCLSKIYFIFLDCLLFDFTFFHLDSAVFAVFKDVDCFGKIDLAVASPSKSTFGLSDSVTEAHGSAKMWQSRVAKIFDSG